MRRRLFVVLCLPSVLYAQVDSGDGASLKDLALNVWHDQAAIITSPARMDKVDAMAWGPAAVSMLVLTPNYNDRRSIGERLAGGIDRNGKTYQSFFKKLTYLGDGGVLFGTAAAGYALGSWRDDPRMRQFTARWLEALADATIWATAFKVLAGRNRPGGPEPQSRFTGPTGYFRHQNANSSFPSGHATLAFASAAVILRETDYNPWVAVPTYMVAGGVSFSRVYVEKHWITDVVMGAALGHSIGMLVENRRSRHRPNRYTQNLEPVFDEDQEGLRWVFRW
jgi:membrane-associated phospholipid phosphatase